MKLLLPVAKMLFDYKYNDNQRWSRLIDYVGDSYIHYKFKDYGTKYDNNIWTSSEDPISEYFNRMLEKRLDVVKR